MNPIPEDIAKLYMAGRKWKLFAWILVFVCLAAAGIAAFLINVLGGEERRAWQVFLSNYLFWTGISFGSVFLLSLMNMTNAVWIRPFKRLVEAPASFLPLSYGLFWLIFWGRKTLLPWVSAPIPQKAPYLNVPFFFAREGALLLILVLCSMALLYFSLKGDLEAVRRKGEIEPEKSQKLWRAQIGASIVFSGLYVLILTVVSWDLIMSLSPEWVSTLFGPYFFIGCLYSAIALLAVSAGISFYKTPLRRYLGSSHFHSLGMTQFAFLMVFGDFFFSQLLLIWYGNKSDEAKFLIERFAFSPPWGTLSIAAGIMTLLLPFLVLLSRKVKLKPFAISILSLFILSGMWLERYILVVPSLWKHPTIPLGWIEVLISIGFLGLMGLSMLVFLWRYPLLPLSDPLLEKGLERAKKSQ